MVQYFAHLDSETTDEFGTITCSFRVTSYADENVETDTIEVQIRLVDTGDEDDSGRKTYDSEVSVGNGDFAGIDDMVTALQLSVAKFKELGLDTKFGDLVGM